MKLRLSVELGSKATASAHGQSDDADDEPEGGAGARHAGLGEEVVPMSPSEAPRSFDVSSEPPRLCAYCWSYPCIRSASCRI